MADAGYDVADYRDIDPVFGTLAEAEALIARGARARHPDRSSTSCRTTAPTRTRGSRPPLAGGPGAPERDLFWFRPGRGENGDQRPTDWIGEFGGPTWTRTTNPDGTPGDWYLHLFAPEQPDLNWDHPRVRAEFEDILRFWFDRGVDGIRIDSAGAAGQGRRRCPRSGRTSRTRSTTWTGCTTSTGAGGGSPTRTRASGP